MKLVWECLDDTHTRFEDINKEYIFRNQKYKTVKLKMSF